MLTELKKRMKIIKTCNLYLSFFVLGAAVSITGPCLLDLQHMANTDTRHIALVYTARSSGYLLGAILGAVFFGVFQSKQAVLTICNLIVTVTMLGIPWSSKIELLLVFMLINGFTLGAIETGGNVICLQLWGEDSDPFFQGLHFSFGLGGFISPLIAAPFLHRREELPSTDYNTTDAFEEFSLNFSSNFSTNATNIPVQHIQGILYPFTIIAILASLVTILNFVICIISPTEKEVSESKKAKKSDRSKLFMFGIASISFLLLMVTAGTEIGFGQALTAYAVKGKLHATTRTGSYMTSVFWGTFTFGRLVSVYLSMKLSNLVILSGNICTIGVSAVILLLFMPNEWALWLASVVFGIGVSSSYAAEIGYIGSHINIGNKFSGVLTVGCAAGEMLFPFIITYFTETIPDMFAFVTTGGCVLTLFLTLTLYCMFEKIHFGAKVKTKEFCVKNDYTEKNNFSESYI